MTDYANLGSLFTEGELKYLELKRKSNPLFESYSDVNLWHHLKQTGQLDSRYDNEAVGAAFGFDAIEEDEEDKKTFKEKYNNLNAFGKTIEFIGDILPDWEVAQRAYNKSLTGVIRHALMGEEKFEFDPNDDIGILEDAASSAMSFLMPMDMLAMGIGSKAGSFLTSGGKRIFRGNGLNQYLQKKLGKKVTERGIEGLPTWAKMTTGGVRGFFPLASYEGAIGYAHQAVKNNDPNTPDSERKSPWEALGLGVIRGGGLGMLTGGISSGLLGRRASISKNAYEAGNSKVTKEYLSKLAWKDRAAWKMSSTPGLVFTESLAFTGANTSIDAIWNGEDLRGHDIMRDFFANMALFSTLKVQHKVFDRAFESAATINRAMKEKSRESHVNKVINEYEAKSGDSKNSQKFKEILDSLNKEELKDVENIELVQKEAEAIMEDIVYVRNSLAKGKEHFNKDVKAQATLMNLEGYISSLKEKLANISFGSGPREQALKREMEAQLKNLESVNIDYKSKVKEPIEKLASEYLESPEAKDRVEKDTIINDALAYYRRNNPGDRKMPTIIVKGKEYKITDPMVPKKSLENFLKTEEAIFRKEEKKSGDVSDAELGIQKDKDFREGRNPETGEKLLEPGSEDAAYRPDIAKMSENIKDPSRSKNRAIKSLFNKSAKWIKSLLQTYYATTPTTAGASAGQTRTPESIKKEFAVLKKFASYLAKRGKSFTNADPKKRMNLNDIIAYAKEKGTGEHSVAINALLNKMRTIEQARTGVMDASLIGASSAQITGYFGKKKSKLSYQEKVESIGLRAKMLIARAKKYVIERWTPKAEFKSTPITKKLSNLLVGLQEKTKDVSDYLFKDTSNVSLSVRSANNFIRSLIGTKKTSESASATASAAHRFRYVLRNFAERLGTTKIKGKKYSAETLKAVIEVLGMGHTTKSVMKTYGKLRKNEATDVYNKIVELFYKEIKNNKGKDKKEVDGYTISEVKKALDIISKLKKGETYTFKIYQSLEGKNKDKVVKEVTITKETAEAMLRYMLEVPSRVNEVVRDKTLTKAEKERANIERMNEELNIDKDSKDIDRKNMEENKELDNMSSYEKLQYEEKRRKELEEAERIENEWSKSEEYSERRKINNRLKRKGGAESNIKELAPEESNVQVSVLDKKTNKIKKVSRPMNTLIRDIRLKIFGYTDYKIKDKERGPDKVQLEAYERALEEAADILREPGAWEKKLDNKGITPEQKRDLAKLLGRKDGNIGKLTTTNKSLISRLTKDVDIIHGKHTPARDIEYENTSSVWGIKNKIAAGREYFTTTWLLVQKIAEKSTGPIKKYLQKIEDTTSRLDVYNETLRGIGNFEYNAIYNVLRDAGKPEAIKDISWMDKGLMEQVKKDKDNPKLSKEERQANQEVWDKNLESYNASMRSGTAEYAALKTWAASRERIWQIFEDAVLNANSNINPSKMAELKTMLKKMKEKDYLPSFLTREARQHYENSKEFESLRDKRRNELLEEHAMVLTDKIGSLKVKKKDLKLSLRQKSKLYKGYRPEYNKILKELKDKDTSRAQAARREAENKASNEIMDNIEHAELHVKSKNFMSRNNSRLPMFLTVPNANGKGTKVIRTYEQSMFNVLNAYYLSSARFLSVAKAAPEFLGKKFFRGGQGELKTAIERINSLSKEGDKATVRYLEDVVSELVGTKESKSWKLTAELANLSALSGLSGFVTPGFKNLLLGQVQSFTTFSGMQYFNVLRRLMFNRQYRKESMERATKIGAAQYTQRELSFGATIKKNRTGDPKQDAYTFAKETAGTMGKISRKAGDSVYKFSLMTYAENINRMIAIETGTSFANHQFEILSGKNTTLSQKFEAERYFRDVLRFTEKEIKFIKEGKYKDLSVKENLNEFNYLMDKVQVYSHKATQGGVGVLDVPKWMSEGVKKDFLVFQRIATSVTTNVVNSVVKPALRGNFMPLIKYGVANYLSGALMYGAYKMLFDETDPKSLGSEWDKALMYLWRSEAAGIFGMVLDNLPVGLNPYYKGASTGDITRNMMPVILRNGQELLKATVKIGGGYATVKQATHDFFKNSVVLYGQADKYATRQFGGEKSEVFKDAKEAISYMRQYEQDIGLQQVELLGVEGSKNQPYYRDLRDAIYWQDKDAIAKNYFLAVNYLQSYYLKTDEGITEIGAHNKAHQAVMGSLVQMNPVYSTEVKDRTKTKRKQYLDWVREKDFEAYQRILKVEDKYKSNMKMIKFIRSNDKYIQQFSSTPHFNYSKTSGPNKKRGIRFRDTKWDENQRRHKSGYKTRRQRLLEQYDFEYLFSE